MTSYDEFKQGYIEALEWLSIDCSDWTLDQMTTVVETPTGFERQFRDGFTEQMWRDRTYEWTFSDEAKEQIDKDCRTFFDEQYETLEQAVGLETNAFDPRWKTYRYAHAGHDYWLTRNDDGVGFWDRGLGRYGDILTEACQYTEQNVYLGDDGLVHLT